MFGFRTPAKSAENESKIRTPPSGGERAGPSPKTKGANISVRRSIGEWEQERRGEEANMERQGTRQTAAAARPKRMALSQPVKATTSEKPLEGEDENNLPSAEPHKKRDRVAEARASLHKAKLHLNNSRNLKTDIKLEVMQAVEKLYSLVKEAELERTTEKEKGYRCDRQETLMDNSEKMETKDIRKNEEEGKLLQKLEEHSKLLEENRKEMERLRELVKERGNNEERASYANVAAGRQPLRNTAVHAVAIYSTGQTDMTNN
ncbi:unnamed protein product, partial [Iphiclides podalirius]